MENQQTWVVICFLNKYAFLSSTVNAAQAWYIQRTYWVSSYYT